MCAVSADALSQYPELASRTALVWIIEHVQQCRWSHPCFHFKLRHVLTVKQSSPGGLVLKSFIVKVMTGQACVSFEVVFFYCTDKVRDFQFKIHKVDETIL